MEATRLVAHGSCPLSFDWLSYTASARDSSRWMLLKVINYRSSDRLYDKQNRVRASTGSRWVLEKRYQIASAGAELHGVILGCYNRSVSPLSKVL
jgi:hypothetical protein